MREILLIRWCEHNEPRHFHDFISEIEAIGDDPEELNDLLTKLREWKVLESRAILEITQEAGLDIIEKFHELIVNDAPETASKKTKDKSSRPPWRVSVAPQPRMASAGRREDNIQAAGGVGLRRY